MAGLWNRRVEKMVGNNVKLIETEIRWWKALIDLYLGNSSFVEWLSANNFDTMAPALPACICANLWNGSITCKPLCVRCTQNAQPIEVKWSGVAGKAEGLRKSINVYNYCRPLQKLRNHFYGLPFSILRWRWTRATWVYDSAENIATRVRATATARPNNLFLIIN